jgi:hypothetical protein
LPLLFSFANGTLGWELLWHSRGLIGMRPEAPAHMSTLGLYEVRPAWGITGLRSRRSPNSRGGWAANPLRNFPITALVWALTFFGFFTSMCIAYAVTNSWTSSGLLVFVAHRGVPVSTLTPGLTAPLVKIDAYGSVYLNYKQTTWEELPTGLDRALAGVPMRVVYVDGDRDAVFMDAVRVIDVAQGLGAKTILLTPTSKEELWKGRSGAANVDPKIAQ